jgi:hypothetical protein
MPTDYFLGLDLGQTNDYTALAVLERTTTPDFREASYALRHLQRYQLGTTYTAIVTDIASIASRPALRDAPVVVDQTGVGRAVVDQLRQQPAIAQIVPVTITGGHTVTTTDDGSWHVPKKELVTALQLLLQNRKLQIAQSLPEAKTLVHELQQFQVRITASANEVFSVWRDGQHDDLVFAAALAVWWAERYPGGEITAGGRSIVLSAPRGVFMTSDYEKDGLGERR